MILRRVMTIWIITIAIGAILALNAGNLFAAYESSLVGFWNFEDGTGTTASDLTGAHDGTIYDADWATDRKIGDYALNFNGTTDAVEITNAHSINYSNGISISTWVKFSQFENFWRTIMASYKQSNDGWALELYKQYPFALFYVQKSGVAAYASFDPSSLETDTWYSLIGTYNPITGRANVYLNGQLVNNTNQDNAGINPTTPSWEAYFGIRPDQTTDLFPGKIDDSAIWNRTLSSDEITQIFNFGVQGFEFLMMAEGLEYNTAEMALIWDAYQNQTSVLIDGIRWQYVTDTPGNHTTGDAWTENGKYYIKLGSGLEGGEVPEPTTLLGILLMLGGLFMQKTRKFLPLKFLPALQTGKLRIKLFFLIFALLLITPSLSFAAYESSLLGYWNFEDGTGTSLTDLTGENNGSINSATWNTDRKIGNYSLNFDGSDDYVSINNSRNYTYSNGITVSGWIKFALFENTHRTMMASYNTSSDGWALEITKQFQYAYLFLMVSGTSAYTTFDVTNLQTDTWYSIAGTYNQTSGRVNMYLNGQLANMSNFDVPGLNPVTPSRDAYFGVRPDIGTGYFSGKLDDFGIWNRTVSGDEIKAIYDLGIAGKSLTDFENILTGISALGLGYDSSDILKLTDLYIRGSGTIIAGNDIWTYYASDPAWVPEGLNIGDTYSDGNGNYYIKLGSGLGGSESIPEPATLLGILVMFCGLLMQRIRKFLPLKFLPALQTGKLRAKMFFLIFAILLFAPSFSFASEFTLLHEFSGGTDDGGTPFSSLILDSGTSTLYGTTTSGGYSGAGTIFSIKTSGADYTLLHEFAGGTDDGNTAYGSLAFDSTTNPTKFYGTTFAGGDSGAGTIYSKDISGSGYSLLYELTGGGGPALGSLVINPSTTPNTIYGTTSGLGDSSTGTIFSAKTDGTGFATLHTFAGGEDDGSNPYSQLIPNSSTNPSVLYGVTTAGGDSNLGTIFSTDTSGNVTLLHEFSGGGNDGKNPYGSLTLDSSTNTLYGMTSAGGSSDRGTAFSIKTSGSDFTLLHDFAAGGGAMPIGSLTLDSGKLYGMTLGNTLFSMNTDGTGFATLHNLTGGNNNGSTPYGSLIIDSGKLYGTTSAGGDSNKGTVFSLDLVQHYLNSGIDSFHLNYAPEQIGSLADLYRAQSGSLTIGPITWTYTSDPLAGHDYGDTWLDGNKIYVKFGSGLIGDGYSPPAPPPPPTGSVAGYAYRKSVSVDYTKVSGDLTDFPILFNLTDANLATVANGGHVTNNNGYDIIFADAAGNPLDFQIESYNPTTGTFTAWVKLSSLSDSADTTFYAYYGNPDINSSQENITEVWNDNYHGVWHLDQTDETLFDSTTNHNNGVPYGVSQGETGQIGNAIYFDSNGYVNYGNDPSFYVTTGSLQAWINCPNQGGWPPAAGTDSSDFMISVSGGSLDFGGYINVDGNNYQLGTRGGGIAPNTWTYIILTFDGNIITAYVNGTSVQSINASGTIQYSGNPDFVMGGSDGSNWTGYLDEVRLSSTALSPEWIATEYTNQSSPGDFLGLGAEQENPSVPEPATVIGFILMLGGILIKRMKKFLRFQV